MSQPKTLDPRASRQPSSQIQTQAPPVPSSNQQQAPQAAVSQQAPSQQAPAQHPGQQPLSEPTLQTQNNNVERSIARLKIVSTLRSNDLEKIQAIAEGPHANTELRNDLLDIAVQVSDLEVVKFLLHKYPDIDVNAQTAPTDEETIYNKTPLHLAAEQGREEVVLFLLQQPEVDDTLVDSLGRQPMEVARYPEIAETIQTERNKYVEKISNEMKVAFDRGDLQAIDALLTNPRSSSLLDINGHNPETGSTVLHDFAHRRDARMVEFILSHGGDPLVRNKNGQLPSDLTKDETIRQMLQKSTAKQQVISEADIANGPPKQSNPAPQMKGFLKKWTNFTSGYKLRWFVLEDGVLSYYKKQDSTDTCRGSINMKNAYVRLDKSEDLKFEVGSRAQGGYKFHLKAKHHVETNKWVWNISNAIRWAKDQDGGSKKKTRAPASTAAAGGAGAGTAGNSIPSGGASQGASHGASTNAVTGAAGAGAIGAGTAAAAGTAAGGIAAAAAGGHSLAPPSGPPPAIPAAAAERPISAYSNNQLSPSDPIPGSASIRSRAASSSGAPDEEVDLEEYASDDDDDTNDAEDLAQMGAPNDADYAFMGRSIGLEFKMIRNALTILLQSNDKGELNPRNLGLGLKALEDGVSQLERLHQEYTGMVQTREVYYQRRLAREIDIQHLWEQNVQSLEKEHEKIQRELHEATQQKKKARRSLREAYTSYQRNSLSGAMSPDPSMHNLHGVAAGFASPPFPEAPEFSDDSDDEFFDADDTQEIPEIQEPGFDFEESQGSSTPAPVGSAVAGGLAGGAVSRSAAPQTAPPAAPQSAPAVPKSRFDPGPASHAPVQTPTHNPFGIAVAQADAYEAMDDGSHAKPAQPAKSISDPSPLAQTPYTEHGAFIGAHSGQNQSQRAPQAQQHGQHGQHGQQHQQHNQQVQPNQTHGHAQNPAQAAAVIASQAHNKAHHPLSQPPLHNPPGHAATPSRDSFAAPPSRDSHYSQSSSHYGESVRHDSRPQSVRSVASHERPQSRDHQQYGQAPPVPEGQPQSHPQAQGQYQGHPQAQGQPQSHPQPPHQAPPVPQSYGSQSHVPQAQSHAPQSQAPPVPQGQPTQAPQGQPTQAPQGQAPQGQAPQQRPPVPHTQSQGHGVAAGAAAGAVGAGALGAGAAAASQSQQSIPQQKSAQPQSQAQPQQSQQSQSQPQQKSAQPKAKKDISLPFGTGDVKLQVEDQKEKWEEILDENSFAGYEDPPRKQLAISADNRPKVSLWGILKNLVGKDMTKMTLPVSFNECSSLLQRVAEDMEYTDLLDKARTFDDSTKRLAYVAAFAASEYASTTLRVAKPFNPLLGETYEYARPDKKFRFFSEQVSHHPPIGACHAESPYWDYMGESNVKSKFTGRAFDINPLGTLFLNLRPDNAPPELYTWKKVNTQVVGIITGSPVVDNYGDMTIVNHDTGDSCTLHFKARGWRGAGAFEVKGNVVDKNGNPQWTVGGHWHEKFYLKKHGSESKEVIWEVNPRPAAPFNLTPFAITLNALPDRLKPWLAPTDTRLRPDQRAMEEARYDDAAVEKNRVEEKQRAARREREAKGEVYKPRFFTEAKHPVTGETYFKYNGEYWKERGEKNFTNMMDIF
ncbi:Oxysterol-binding protein-like protein C2F12.05c [Yarrowia sp. B02]|nr:Oxysterol-binding protein-like protein C2F12.05c [Yarrowia sp. B02]